MSLAPELQAKICRALNAGHKPLEVARKLHVPLLKIAALIPARAGDSGPSQGTRRSGQHRGVPAARSRLTQAA